MISSVYILAEFLSLDPVEERSACPEFGSSIIVCSANAMRRAGKSTVFSLCFHCLYGCSSATHLDFSLILLVENWII